MTGFIASQLSQTWLIIAPHPDDEVLGCGLLMRAIAASQGACVIVWLTDGGASHGELPPTARNALVSQRQAEALAGLAALGIEPLATYFLGHADGSLASESVQSAARAQLAELSDAHAATAFAVTAADDSHADHRGAFDIAAGLSLPGYAYPVSGRYDGDRVDVAAQAIALLDPAGATLKRFALACHRSQTAEGGARWPLSQAAIDRFCNEPEVFIPISRLAS